MVWRQIKVLLLLLAFSIQFVGELQGKTAEKRFLTKSTILATNLADLTFNPPVVFFQQIGCWPGITLTPSLQSNKGQRPL